MMHDRTFLAPFGIKFNPFSPSIPVAAVWRSMEFDRFLLQMGILVREGGFAMITGEPGIGKSKALQLLSVSLSKQEDIMVGVMQRPQSTLGDFYREMGHLFGLSLRPANRYGSFKALRMQWKEHFKTTLVRPVLLIDEAQEMRTSCLNEIRLLGSDNFDSECLLTTVLCGDERLPNRFRTAALAPLGSRVRARMNLRPLEADAAIEFLDHVLKQAGGEHLMSQELKQVLADHCAGNLRVLCGMANELLTIARDKDLARMDEKLFLDTFNVARKRSASSMRRAGQRR